LSELFCAVLSIAVVHTYEHFLQLTDGLRFALTKSVITQLTMQHEYKIL